MVTIRHPEVPVLEVEHLDMRFGATRALQDVSMRVAQGSCVALAGQNGAGKSTLVKVVTGVYPHGSYSGDVHVNGRRTELRTPRDAENVGIAVVQQELTVCPTLTVAENLLLGREPSRLGVIRREELRQRAKEMLAAVRVDLPLSAPAGTLSVGHQQMIEIARAVSRNPSLLVLDEPTSSLSTAEAESLFARLARLQAGGVSILYISHRLDELQEVADRVVVLRDGEVVMDSSITSAGRDEIVHAMLGERLDVAPSASPTVVVSDRAPVLELKGWSVPPVRASDPAVQDVDLSVAAGEIVGVYGAVGSGRSELLMSLFGARAGHGELLLDGERIELSSPREAMRAGLALVTEDRKSLGIEPWMTTAENITLPVLKKVSQSVVPHVDRELAFAEANARSVGLPSTRVGQRITTLSGGNQQKALLARALATSPRLLLLDEPTRGVDVGAKADLHLHLERLAEQGLAVLWVSSEPEELLMVANRIYVMRQGTLAPSQEASRTSIALLVKNASSLDEEGPVQASGNDDGEGVLE